MSKKKQLSISKTLVPITVAIIGSIGMIVAAYITSRPPDNPPRNTTQAAVAIPTDSLTYTPASIASQTSSLISTITQSPTVTINPTVTIFQSETPSPIPSATSVQYISENRAVEFRNGVFFVLLPEFGNTSYINCWYPRTGFTIKFEVTNSSDSEFLLRFNWYDFQAVDDQGQKYTLRASGIDSCSSDPELRTTNLRSNRDVTIFVNFEEDISLEANYLLITVENISNHGPFIFRKDF